MRAVLIALLLCSAAAAQGPGSEFRYRSRAVSDTPADITTHTVYVTSIRVHNRTGTAATFTLSDRDTTPFEYYEAVSVAGNTVFNERVATGSPGQPGAALKFVDGITIAAGTADSLTVEIFGWYAGR